MLSVLVVDDSESVRLNVRGVLERQGYKVECAADGVEALNALAGSRFDLVVSDYRMPKLDGFELCRSIKRDAKHREVPVIILSSYASDDNVRLGFDAGAAAFVTKDEMAAELGCTVERVVRSAKLNRSKTIMVVEDSRSIRQLVCNGLRQSGFKTVSAENGADAFRLITEGLLPDLIVTDIEMPVMDGAAFLRRVKPVLPEVPVVVMSSCKGRASVRHMMSLGASGYIVKPFDLEQLVVTVEIYLSAQYRMLQQEKVLLQAEKKMMLGSIAGISAALEARDHYTRGHSEAVSVLLLGMAKVFNFTNEEMDLLAVAGKLHDIGKIGVPDHILLKPGRLSHEEYEVIKQHPGIAMEILREIPTLERIMDVILHHHERMDGKGYPDGLKGEQIPLWARMTAVADIYDALTSDRPYRKGLPRDEAMQIIWDARGDQLCPECVSGFMDVLGG